MSEDEKEGPRREFRKMRTKGFIKLTNHFEDVLRRDAFQDRLRGLKGLPPQSLELNAGIEKLCKDFGLDDPSWVEIVSKYLFTGHYDREENIYAYSYDLCYLGDTETFKPSNSSASDEFYDEVGFLENMDKEYPVVLRISPHASVQDIISFVNKNSKFLKLLQNKHKDPNITIGKARTKSIKGLERGDIIYENRHLSLEKIGRVLVKQGHQLIDVGHIGKILSLEKKKRKQV